MGGGDAAAAGARLMWAVGFRFTGTRVEALAQGWLLGSATVQAVIPYMHALAAELSREPDLYGFDPGLTYTAFVQTWDRALSPMPSLALGRSIVGQDAVRLIPDVYFLKSDGFRDVREHTTVAPPWRDRLGTLAWRGSVTGSGPYAAPEQIPRIQLALAAKRLPDADIALIGIHPTMAEILPSAMIDAFIAEQDLTGESWDLRSFARHKFVLDIDGHANAWGLLEKLILGCCVLKVASPYEQWFYARMIPGVHYVPVRADLSDLAEVLAWCRDHEDRCEWIAGNGALLARSITSDREVGRSCEALVAVAHVQGRSPGARPDAAADQDSSRPKSNLLDQAAAAVGAGELERAIALYEVAADHVMNPGRQVEALVRLASLHREMGQVRLAVAALARASVLAPDDAMLKLQIAQFALSIGRDFTACEQLVEAVRIAGHFNELRINLADQAVRVGWLDLAYWTVRTLPAELSDWWARTRQVATSRYEAERARAKSLFQSRREAGGLSHGLRWELAISLAFLGRLRLAERLCRDVIAETPVMPPHDLMSRIIARKSGVRDAVAYLEALPAHLHQERDFIARLARFQLDTMQFESMLEMLDRNPEVGDTFDGRFSKTIALISLDRKTELHAHCREWMAREPADELPAGILAAAHSTFAFASERRADPGADIPLVQFWDTPEIPQDVLGVMNGWVTRNPELKQTIVSDEQARIFLAESLGEAASATYALCHHAAMKADFFRVAWLYVRGGIYIDADEACLRPIGELLAAAADCDISAVRSGDMIGYLHNYFLGARAGSPVMGWALEEASRAIHDARAQGQQPSIWHATGPGLITRAAGRYLVTPEATSGAAILLPFQQYHYYARTESDLSYKRKRTANWQLA